MRIDAPTADLTDVRREYEATLARLATFTDDDPRLRALKRELNPRMIEMQQSLGISNEMVDAHIVARRDAATYQREFDAIPVSASPDEQRKSAELVAEVDRLWKAHQAKLLEKQVHLSNLEMRQKNRNALFEEIARLERSHPIAFGIPAPAPRRVTMVYTRHDTGE